MLAQHAAEMFIAFGRPAAPLLACVIRRVFFCPDLLLRKESSVDDLLEVRLNGVVYAGEFV